MQIQSDVKLISEGINNSAQAAKHEVEKGKETTEALGKVRGDMQEILEGATDIMRANEESSKAAVEVAKRRVKSLPRPPKSKAPHARSR